MTLFEKIYWTVFIILTMLFIMGMLWTVLTKGDVPDTIIYVCFYPIGFFGMLSAGYLIVYCILSGLWNIELPFFIHKLGGQ